MKKQFIFVFTAAAAISCNDSNRQQTTYHLPERYAPNIFDPVRDAGMLMKALEPAAVPAQHFIVSADTEQDIVAANGTVLHFSPGALETVDGSPLSGKLEIDITELHSQPAMLKSCIATVSDGRILSSGGVYHIRCTAHGKPLRIQKGKTLDVSFPKIAAGAMALFYGERDKLGDMNWKPSGNQLVQKTVADSMDITLRRLVYTDTVYTRESGAFQNRQEPNINIKPANGVVEESETYTDIVPPMLPDTVYVIEKVPSGKLRPKDGYAPVAIAKLGWLHVARFTSIAATATLSCITPSMRYGALVKTYVVLSASNSIVSCTARAGECRWVHDIGGLPAGESVRLIALCWYQGTLRSYSSGINLPEGNADNNVQLDLQPVQAIALKDMWKRGADG